jgi:hypothetical protein
LGAATQKTIIETLSSGKGLLHQVLLLPHVLLTVSLDIREQLFAVVFVAMPLYRIKIARLLLKPLQHRLVIIDNLLVIAKPFFVVQRLF